MPSSTAVSQFQASVLTAFDALRRENERRDERLRAAELILAHDSGVKASTSSDSERIRKLEAALVEPVRLRALEEKVTRLGVRSASIGAAGGLLASAIVNAALHYFLTRPSG